jgi:hypothetical protein
MQLKGTYRLIFISLLLLAVQPVIAQEQEGISVGQMKLLLTAGLTWGNDDNITGARSGLETSSDFYVFSPGIRLEAPSDRSLFALTFEGESGSYSDSSIDDYDDWSLGANWDYDPTSRTSVGLLAEMREGHDRRGEGRTQGDSGTQLFAPDEYDLISYGGYFDYGAVGSRGRLEVEALFTERDYTNNLDQTQFLDRDEEFLEATFFMRVRPKTSLLVGMGLTDIDYVNDRVGFESLDSEETRYFVGITWDISARTSGRIDIGKLEKDFKDPLRKDYDDNFYRGTITWQPRTYSTFTLTATKETDEADYFGEYVLRDEISLDWRHSWSTRFNTILEYGTGDDVYEPAIRNDDVNYWGIEGRWQINQHFQLGLGFQDYERDSDDAEFDYDRGVWLLTLEGSL